MAKSKNGSRASVLIVDDESSIRESLRMILEYEGYRVSEAKSGAEALVRIADKPPNALLLDIKMPEMDGLAVLTALRERGYEMPVLMISGHADVDTAVEATRRGAFDFFEKPLERERVLLSLRNAVASYRLQTENRVLRHEPDDMVGASPSMKRLRETIEKAAPTPATVLITGESGTGKELVARAIHGASPRRERTFVQVNCAAIPDELIESELFGHEKGSFTGAMRKQMGKFVAADGGTIFLDEIGEMSARTQANNYKPKEFAAEALEHLGTLPWKGNVRELKNLVERLLILSPGPVIDKKDIINSAGGTQLEISESLLAVKSLREFRDLAERLFLVHKLEENGWNVTQTAQTVETPRSNLYKKMEQYDIRRGEP